MQSIANGGIFLVLSRVHQRRSFKFIDGVDFHAFVVDRILSRLGSSRGAREEGRSARAVMMCTHDNLGRIRHTFCKTKVAEYQLDHRKFFLRALGGK